MLSRRLGEQGILPHTELGSNYNDNKLHVYITVT